MAEQGRSLRITRASKKRAAAATTAGAGGGGEERQAPATKKRVVLGELPNLSNVVAAPAQGGGGGPSAAKPKPRRQPKAIRGRVVRKPAAESAASGASLSGPSLRSEDGDPKIEAEPASDDPQMCRAYVADIYDYLHKMEVSAFRFISSDGFVCFFALGGNMRVFVEVDERKHLGRVGVMG